MRRTPLAAVAVILAFVIAGCGGDDGDLDGASTPIASTAPVTTPPADPTPSGTPSAAPTVDCTKIFSQKSAEALAGEALGSPKADAVSSLSGCRWDSAETGAWVLARAVPASTWAKAVPEAIATVLDSEMEFEGRDKLQEARRLIEEGGDLDDAAACGIFSTMASALQGQPVGTTRVISYVPNREAAQGINEQACLAGRFYSVQLVSPTLKPGPALEKRIKRALATIST